MKPANYNTRTTIGFLGGAVALAALLAACGGGPSGTTEGLSASGSSLSTGSGGDTAGTGTLSGTGSTGGDTSSAGAASGSGSGSTAGGSSSSGGSSTDTSGGSTDGSTAGTTDGSTGGSTGGGTTTPTDPVGGSIEDSHSNSQDQFNAELQDTINQLNNQGTLCTDNGAKQILGKKISSISHFVDNAANIVTAAIQAGQPVDKQALINLLNGYRAADKAWLANPTELLAACGWTLEEFTATKAQKSNSIDSLYDGLISLILSL